MKAMRKLLPVLGVLLAVAVILPAMAQVKKVDQLHYGKMPEFKPKEPTRVVLDNGMVVMLVEDHELGLVDVAARVRTGGRLEPADKIGVAQLTGMTLRTGGTTSMTGDELDEYLEGKAAFIETSIGTSSGSANMGCLAEDFGEVLKVFAQVLRNPVFEEDKFEVAKTQVSAGIARQNDNPFQIMFREYNEIIYGADSPYVRPTTYDTLNNIERADLVAWHKEFYYPNRIILGIAGDFKTDEAIALVKQVFGDWKMGPKAETPEIPYNKSVKSGVYYVEKDDMTQSNIIMGHMGIQRDNPDYYAVELLNQVLSGGFGSRMFSNIRSKKGLAYAVNGSVGSNWDYEGSTSLWMTTKVETTAAGIDAIFVEARNLTAKPPTDEEVDKAKAAILNSFVFNSDSTLEVLNQQLTYEYYGYPSDWLARYQKGIESTSTAAVQKAAAKYIHPEQFAILVVGPKEGQDRPLSEFGEVAMVDITIPEPAQEEVAASPESLKKGEMLIAKACDGMGGADRVDSVRRVDQKSTVVLTMPQGEMEVKASTLVDFPNRVRQEMVTPMGTITMVATPEQSFMQSPQGVQPMPAAQRDDMLKGLRRDLVALLKMREDGDFRAIAMGTGDVNGTQVENVVVEYMGDSTTLGIDPKTGHVVTVSYRGKAPMTGAPGQIVQVFSDWKEIDGLMYPMTVKSTFEGKPSTSTTINSMSVDGPLDETAFAMPEGAATSGGR